jgi:hypothetical protein
MVADSKKKPNNKRISKKGDKVLEVSAEKESSNVSVITKTTTPKIVVQSENVSNDCCFLNKTDDKNVILRFICLLIMCIILLMTFFLSLRTYNTVNELSNYIHWIIVP